MMSETITGNFNIINILELIAILVTATAAIVSIVIAVVTLRQNQKMIEESTRPYIVIYGTVTNFQSPMYKLVIKNFGQSGGTITNFVSKSNLSELTFGNSDYKPFSNLRNTFFAPGQSIICNIDYQKIVTNEISNLKFEIEYKSNSKMYGEIIDVNVKAVKGQSSSRASTKDKELKIISYALQELVEKLL